MQLSISNIAWSTEDRLRVYEFAKMNGFSGIDIAPGKLDADPFTASHKEHQGFLDDVAAYGLTLAGMQSLLYGTKDMAIFEGKEKRIRTSKHLLKIIDLASLLGVQHLVFGSPKNRLIGTASLAEIMNISKEFFGEIGAYAHGKGISFCLEANPREYGADFLTSTLEAAEFVEQLNIEGIWLQYDLGTSIINGESITDVVSKAHHLIKHVHISQPNLIPVSGANDIDKHKELAEALRSVGFQGYAAIEMLQPTGSHYVEQICEAIAFVSEIYGGKCNA